MTDISFSQVTEAWGRNRWTKMAGVSVVGGPDTVRLWPITSKGHSNAAMLQIPIDDVPAVIEALRAEIRLTTIPQTTEGV